MAKVSVIIPAYNAAKTIEKTVRSVLASTIPIDVFVINDGSTDGTGACLEKLGGENRWAAVGSALHVLHQRNQGAYMARLNALKQIKTPWFGFVDADDAIEPDMFEKMLAVAEKENCDVVQCAVSGIPDSVLGQWYVELIRLRNEVEVDNGGRLLLGSRADIEDKFITPHLVKGDGASYIWNKLYRNQYDFSKFVTFGRLTNFDDMIFNFQFFEKVNRMAFVEDRLYRYAQTDGGATHSYGARQFEDFKTCAKFRKHRGISACPWYWINLKSGIASVLRSDLPLVRKAYWVTRLVLDA